MTAQVPAGLRSRLGSGPGWAQVPAELRSRLSSGPSGRQHGFSAAVRRLSQALFLKGSISPAVPQCG